MWKAEEWSSMETIQNDVFSTMLTTAKTIGTHMLTIKLHERLGATEQAEIVRKQNAMLETQLDKMIDLFYSMKDKT